MFLKEALTLRARTEHDDGSLERLLNLTISKTLPGKQRTLVLISDCRSSEASTVVAA
jgi:hypothetical protein